MPDKITITAPDGTEAEIERVKQLSNGGVRLDVEPTADTDARRWRVDVTASGKDYELVTSWRGDDLADLGEPDWLDDVLGELRRAAA